MNCMLVLVFHTSIQAFTLIATNVSRGGRSGRLFLVSVFGLTTSRDGFCESFYLGKMLQNKLFRCLRFSFHKEIEH